MINICALFFAFILPQSHCAPSREYLLREANKIEGYCHHLKFWVKEVPKKVDFRNTVLIFSRKLKKKVFVTFSV